MRTEDELIAMIFKLKNKLNKVPTQREFCKEYRTNIPKHLKFNTLLEKAGLNLNKKAFNKKEVEKEFNEYLQKNKKFPPATSWGKLGLSDPKTIIKHYGSVNAFKSMFVDVNFFYQYTEKEMIKYLQKKIDSGEITSTSDLIENKKLPNLGMISRILKKKTWEEILVKIDRIEIQKTFIKEKMKKEYIQISEKLNKHYGASIPDIKKYSKYSVTSFFLIFRGMEGLRKECNFENPYLKSKLNFDEIKKTAIELFKQHGKLSKTDLTKVLKEKEISIESVFKAFKVMNLRNLYKKLNQE